MASIKKPGPKKSEFVRGVLTRNPEANGKAVDEAWKRAGNQGTISPALLYLIKSQMKKGSKQPTNGTSAGTATYLKPKVTPTKGKKSQTALGAAFQNSQRTNGQKTARGTKGAALEELETDIDRLIFKLMGMGGLSEVEDALRQARRLLVRHHH